MGRCSTKTHTHTQMFKDITLPEEGTLDLPNDPRNAANYVRDGYGVALYLMNADGQRIFKDQVLRMKSQIGKVSKAISDCDSKWNPKKKNEK